MIKKEQRHRTSPLLIAGVLVFAAFILHNGKAHAATNCRLVIASYPAMQISLVSRECWEAPEAAPVIPRVKPLPMVEKAVQPRRKVGVCGSKRQVWRTLKNGKRKYRCR